MKNKYLIIGIILILVFSLAGCSGKQDNSKSAITKKVNSELDYLDDQLLGMLNKLNKISFQKYLVVSEEITSDSANISNQSGGESSTKQGETSGQSDSSEDSSSEESSQGEDAGGAESSGESSGGDSKTGSSGSSSGTDSTAIKYNMQPSTILNRDTNVNWNEFNTDIENLYDAWSTITIDLYKQEIDNNLVLSFSTDLQATLNSIKAQDKNSTLVNLAKIYSYVPQFSTIVNGENIKTSILKTKSGLMNAYSLVEQGNWQRVQTELNTAEQNYMPVLNGIISNKNKEYNINKAYVLIKETMRSAKDMNKDEFYINYKNLLQELDVIQG